MWRKWRFRRYRYKRYRPRTKPLPFRYVLLLSFAFFLISTMIGLYIVNTGIKPTLQAYARSKSINIATSVINQAIKEQIGEGLSLEDVTRITTHENLTVLALETDKILRYGTDIAGSVIRHINSVEKGEDMSQIIIAEGEAENIKYTDGEGIVFEVPFGRITNNVLLGNLGPNIPIRFQAVGDIQYDTNIVRENHHINSTWYEIWLELKIGIQVIVPFSSDLTMVSQKVLLAAGEARGDIPLYYSNGGYLTPSFIVPDQSGGVKDDNE